MPKIRYIECDGNERDIDVAVGQSVMQGAVANGLRGIIGECGGACSCATCHVYVDPAWLGRIGERNAAEKALLEEVIDERSNSRLSCQIKVTQDIDGLIVRLPEKQI